MQDHQNFSESQIVFEDNHLIVINKKVGQLVQGDKTGDFSLLDLIKNFIKKRDQKPGNVFLGLVHRIDRPTSGLVIYAKTSKALSRLTQMVKNREIKKTYWAVVAKEMIPQRQRLIHYLQKNEKITDVIIWCKKLGLPIPQNVATSEVDDDDLSNAFTTELDNLDIQDNSNLETE